ncbi:MAG: ATP-binding cassette domain-containing protein [Chloroflexia bacterium]
MSSFWGKSAAGVVSALQEMLFAEDLAHRPGLLQRLGTRIRVFLLALLLAVALAVRLEFLAGLFPLILGLAWASRVPLGRFARRVGALSLFTVLVALPALFLTPGEPLLILLHSPYAAITVSGVWAAATLVLRVAASISLVLLLSMTTPWPALGLSSRGRSDGPSDLLHTVLLLLSMTRRYLFLFLRKAEEMLLSRESRRVGRLPAREGRKCAAGMAGALIARTYQMSREVALAVEAREVAVWQPPSLGEPPLLEAHRVRYTYPGDVIALDGVDLEVRPGEHLAVLGANGSGKSTLLKVLDGLYFPQEGEVYFRGLPVNPKTMEDEHFARDFHRRVGLVFQDPDVQLFSATVWEEVAFAPLQMELSRENVRERVEGMLARLGLSHLGGRPPYRLSEGEKRKVALASVLVHEPEVLLLDEPTSSLDPRSRAQLLDLLREWGEREAHTLVFCTHDLALAQELAHQVVVLDRGRVLASGRPEEVLADRALLEEANLVWRRRA